MWCGQTLLLTLGKSMRRAFHSRRSETFCTIVPQVRRQFCLFGNRCYARRRWAADEPTAEKGAIARSGFEPQQSRLMLHLLGENDPSSVLSYSICFSFSRISVSFDFSQCLRLKKKSSGNISKIYTRRNLWSPPGAHGFFCDLKFHLSPVWWSQEHENSSLTNVVVVIVSFIFLPIQITISTEFSFLSLKIVFFLMFRLAASSERKERKDGHYRDLGAVANYRHFVSNERCSFELNTPPPPLLQTNTYITCIWKKCWPRNAGIVYMMRYTWWCLALRSILGKACDVPGSTKGLFSSWAGWECTFRHSFCASLTALATARLMKIASQLCRRRWQTRASPRSLHVSEVCNIVDFLLLRNDQEAMQKTRSSPKMPIFLPNEQASTLPPLKRTSFVWNKMPVIGDGPLRGLDLNYRY